MSYTDDQFTAAIRKAVEIRGADYLYPTPEFIERNPEYADWRTAGNHCKYQAAGEPACLIGLALHLIDPELVPDEHSFQDADSVLEELGFDPGVARAALTAQTLQDEGESWGGRRCTSTSEGLEYDEQHRARFAGDRDQQAY